ATREAQMVSGGIRRHLRATSHLHWLGGTWGTESDTEQPAHACKGAQGENGRHSQGIGLTSGSFPKPTTLQSAIPTSHLPPRPSRKRKCSDRQHKEPGW